MSRPEDDDLFSLLEGSSDATDGLAQPVDVVYPSTDHSVDVELDAVQRWLHSADPHGAATAATLRESLDQVLDGPRTMRFRYSDLRKTEKTHIGTVVEINLAKRLQLEDGDRMDYRIAGVDVDCKYSMKLGGWELPLESMGHIVLLVWADDFRSEWSAGLWRVNPEHLGRGEGNRDKKRKMLKSGQEQIVWLWHHYRLDENLLLHLPAETVDAIFTPKSGQQRINELFRRVQHRIIRREVVLTVAQQKDGPRRARMARETRHLGKEGILVLGHYEWDVSVARTLDLPVPNSGEWISARVAPTDDEIDQSFLANGGRWRLAERFDRPTVAPTVPHSKPLGDD